MLTVDMKLFRDQRRTLLHLRAKTQEDSKEREHLDGIINMLDDVSDALQDNGEAVLIVSKS